MVMFRGVCRHLGGVVVVGWVFAGLRFMPGIVCRGRGKMLIFMMGIFNISDSLWALLGIATLMTITEVAKRSLGVRGCFFFRK